MFFKHLMLLGLLFFYLPVSGQANSNYNAYSMSLSGATTATSGFNSLTENQGGLAFCRETSISINYSNRYLLSELAMRSIGYIMPIGMATGGISVSYFGDKAFNESSFSLFYGRKLFDWLGAGVKMNYHYLSVEAVENHATAISGDVGVQIFPVKGVCIGIEANNPSQSRFVTMNNDKLYSGLNAGISYSEYQQFSIISQYNWENYNKSKIIFACEYWLLNAFSLKVGVKINKNPSYSFGTGIIYKRCLIDFGFEHHTVLGLSAAVSLNFQIRKYER